MARADAHTAFGTCHPAVPAVYLAVTLVLAMSAFHPVLIALSIAGALAYLCCAEGAGPALAPLRWQLPVFALIALVNPLFAHSGSTVLLTLFGSPVFLESLCYGICMAGLLAAGILWLRVAGRLISFDKAIALMGNAAPVLALMVSMSMRLIPQLVRRGRHVAAVQEVMVPRGEADARAGGSRGAPRDCAAEARGASGGRSAMPRGREISRRLRMSSVLMGWAMEDSLVAADVMRARGWGAAPRRTTYARYRFSRQDALALIALGVTGIACAVLAWTAAGAFRFYPALSPLTPWWGYVPFAAWMAVPALLHLYERSVWS